MGLKSWWLESRLNRIESKLRTKRGLLRRARDKEAKAEGDAKAKLHAERERLTREINALIVEEEHVKKDLDAAGGVNQSELRARP
ncbi:MAG: hypothetical protein QOE90_3509 [Thermoplasmata archaeon]|jgi:peptidoglycan hydrolase CwlO-like protein|nr:hypothetical protein [Thermoplasmata archaeon]